MEIECVLELMLELGCLVGRASIFVFRCVLEGTFDLLVELGSWLSNERNREKGID